MSGLGEIQGLNQASADVAAYRGSDLAKAAMDMLSRLEARYVDELLDAKTDRVTALQSAIKQIRKLRQTFGGEPSAPTI